MAYQTENNIQEAFGGESKANRRYTLFAEKADKDGYPQVAKLFRAVAEAEMIHIRNHLKVIFSKVTRHSHPQRRRYGCAGMPRSEGVIIAFRTIGETGQSAILPERVEPVSPACNKLMNITLMPYIPYELILRAIEHSV